MSTPYFWEGYNSTSMITPSASDTKIDLGFKEFYSIPVDRYKKDVSSGIYVPSATNHLLSTVDGSESGTGGFDVSLAPNLSLAEKYDLVFELLPNPEGGGK